VNRGLLFLLVFTSLAFGAVEPWSISIMEFVAFGTFLLHAAQRGLSLPARRPARALLALFLLLVGLVLLQLLPLSEVILKAVSPAADAVWRRFGDAPAGTRRTMSLYPDATRQELFRVLAYAAVFVVVVRECRTRAQVRSLATAILLMGGFLAVFAVVQKLTWNGRIFWVFPVSELKRSGRGIWGPFINRNHFAGYLAMVIPLGLGLLMSVVRDSRDHRDAALRRRLGRFLASDGFVPSAGIFLLVVLMSACLFSTKSRGAMAAWAVASLFLLWITWRRRSLRARALAPLLAAAAVGAVVLLPSWERVAQRFEDLGESQQVGRLHVLDDALGIVADYPLFGTGFGTFGQIFRRYQTTHPRLYYDHAHNDYLEMATDTGSVGFLLATATGLVFFFSLFRAWRGTRSRFASCIGAGGLASCVAITVHSVADFNLRIPANALLFTLVAGLTYAAIFNLSGRRGNPPAAGNAAPPRPAAATRPLLGLGAALLALLVLSLPAREFLADFHFRRVERMLDDKSTPELDLKPIGGGTIDSYARAIASLTKAAGLEPSRSIYPQALGELYARLGAWATTMESLAVPLPAGALSGKQAHTLAIAATQRAVFLEPTNPVLHLTLARLFAAEDGGLARANAQIRLALAAHPASAPLRAAAAELYLAYGGKREALAQAVKLAALDDSYLIPESARKALLIERRAPAYLARLKASFLFQALEIAWRATGDVRVVKGLAPPGGDARAVLDLFLEWRGIEA
jgi:O-antigen ligase